MKLSIDKLIELSHGAVRVEEKNNKISFYRFTEEQELLYKNCGNEGFYLKTFAPAGVSVVFKTDSTSLFLKCNVPFATSRSYFSVDICVNGKLIGDINNYNGADMSGNYTTANYPKGCFEKRFDLGDGEKKVSVYLPWSVSFEIEEFSIDDGCFAEPITKDKKMLIFGDSITQGYDILHPSKHFTLALTDYLMADGYNKAIGGEQFVPLLADTDENFVPDYVFVAYGTNDWSMGERCVFEKNCREFFNILSKKYTSAKIFAITPIWRADNEKESKCGEFLSIANYIKEVTKHLQNVHCIDGINFVPHYENVYADFRLHPNDEGFIHYANNLCDAVKKYV